MYTGVSYYAKPDLELYGNFSQNYRSVTFNDIRIVNHTFQVDPDITDESGFSAENGVRGQYGDIFSYDVNVFSLMYDDRLGEVLRADSRVDASGETVETSRVVRFRGNIAWAFIYGLESIAELNLLSLLGKKHLTQD